MAEPLHWVMSAFGAVAGKGTQPLIIPPPEPTHWFTVAGGPELPTTVTEQRSTDPPPLAEPLHWLTDVTRPKTMRVEHAARGSPAAPWHSVIVAETPATIVVSQIIPSPPELSTPFPQDTAIARPGVGGGVGGIGVGIGVGEGVGTGGGVGVGCGDGATVGPGVTTGGTVGVTPGGVGGAVGSPVANGVGPAVGGSVGVPLVVGVAVEPLGAAGNDMDGCTDTDGGSVLKGDHAGAGGKTIGAMSDREGDGKGVGLG